MEIDPLVLMKIFEGFLTIYGHGGHLGHVTQMPRTNFNSPVPWRLHTKFGVDWPCVIVIEEKMFEIATESWVYD